MNAKALIAFLLFGVPTFAQTDQQWILQQSTLTYHVSHPLHTSEGVSHAAKGKGVCHEGQCDFLIAVPVKSFDSGDSNRDLHMLQAVRGAEFPLVTVRTRLPENTSLSATIQADLEIQFAGQTAEFKQVPLQLSKDATISALPGRSRPHSRISRLVLHRSWPFPSERDTGRSRNDLAQGEMIPLTA